MSQTDLTYEAVLDSITGYDEIAIAHHFGKPWTELAEENATMCARSMIFLVKRREGATDDEARNAAMEMTTKDMNGFFAEPSEEEAGKDAPPEPSLELSLTSAS